jgi:hypothetical protein
MASTYSTSLRIEQIGKGEQTGTWDVTSNRNLGTLLEHAISGVLAVSMTDANKTLTTVNGNTDEARYAVLNVTGTISVQRDIIIPAVTKTYVVRNATTGGFALRIKTSGGTGVTIANGITTHVFCNGTDCFEVFKPTTITSQNVTDALGFTPYNATNPSNYITATALSPYAPLASPALTGTPTTTEPPSDSNNTRIATTAFVVAKIAAATAGVSSFNGRQGAVTLSSGDVTGALTYTPANKAGDAFSGNVSTTGTLTADQRIFGRGAASNNGLGKIIVQQGGSPPAMSQGDICFIYD